MTTSTKPSDPQCCLDADEIQELVKEVPKLQVAVRELQMCLSAMAGKFSAAGLPGDVVEQLRAQGAHTRSEMTRWSGASTAAWMIITGIIVGIALIVVNHWWPLPGGSEVR